MAQAYVKNAWTQGALPAVDAPVLNAWETGIYLASAPLVTSLPGSPVDGQEINYLADATNGVVWHFVYRSALGKWLFTGGPPLSAQNNTADSVNNSAYADLSLGPGPSITVPLPGDYIVSYGALAQSGVSDGAWMAPAFGAVAASDNDQVRITQNNVVGVPVSRTLPPRNMAAVGAITLKHRTGGAQTGTWSYRWLNVTPVKVG